MLNNRNFGLDVIRATAIMMVVFSHSILILDNLIPLKYIGPLIGKAISVTFPLGVFGVELFFALSGFLIGGILFRIHNSDDGFTIKGLGKFWSRRWFRTLPAYYLMLLVNFIIWKHFDYHYLFFVQNLASPIPRFFIESWSLAIEEWSYLLFPLVLMVFNYLLPKQKEKMYVILILLYIIISWFIKIAFINQNNKGVDYWEQFIRPVVIARLDAIMYGVLLNYLWQQHKELLVKYRKGMFLIGVSALFLSYAYMILGSKPFYFSAKYAWHRFYGDYLFLPFVNIFSVFLIPRFMLATFDWWVSVKRTITFLSKNSYSMYLLHFSFIFLFLFHQQNAAHLSSKIAIIVFVLFWIATLVGSHYMHLLIEKPFLTLRDKIVKE